MLRLITVILLALLATTANAHAAGVIGIVPNHPQLNANVLEYGGDGAADTISIYYDGAGAPKFTYSAGVDVQAVAPCTATTSSSGECPSAGITYVVAFGGGGNDLITLDMCGLCGSSPTGLIFGEAGDDILTGAASTGSGPSSASYGLSGGDGNDTLRSGNGADTLSGDAGNDVLEASDGADTVNGGAGDDSLSAESLQDAADEYIGGDGFDTIGGNVSTGNDFSEPSVDIAVSLDGVANDGGPGEGDNVMPDVERVKALGRNVTMIGSDAANELIATADSSTIRGLGGDDRLIGSDGADSLEGGEGADYLEGGFGPDVLDGGGGVDQFVGDKTERDVIASGNDQIRARDGNAEQINCGIGSDSAIVDAADVVDPSCEAVDRAAPPVPVDPGPVNPTPPNDTLAQQLGLRVLGSPTLRTLARRGLSFSLTCQTACSVRAELRLGSRSLGSGRAQLRAGRKGTVRVRLTRAGKRRVQGLRRTTLVLRIRVTGADRRTSTITRTLRVKR
jgi:Ca2+-binding RTX toxin-like protein